MKAHKYIIAKEYIGGIWWVEIKRGFTVTSREAVEKIIKREKLKIKHRELSENTIYAD